MSGPKAKPKPRPKRNYDRRKAQDAVCQYLASGLHMKQICVKARMPSENTVYRWLAEDKEFQKRYARARTISTEAMEQEIIEIIDDGRNDWMERQNADGSTYEVVNHEHIMRSRARVDTRKWIMARRAPKKYGDRLDVTSGDKPIKPTRVVLVAAGEGDGAE